MVGPLSCSRGCTSAVVATEPGQLGNGCGQVECGFVLVRNAGLAFGFIFQGLILGPYYLLGPQEL